MAEIQPYLQTKTVDSLLRFGGFPEPLIKGEERFSKIWRAERTQRVIHQDLRDLTNLKDYIELELLADALPPRVGSLLSVNSLAEDLDKSPHTISRWLEVLSSVYTCFIIKPYGPPKIKAMKKQGKLYLWDWSAIEDMGARFENMVASHLLKHCHFIEDTEGDQMELRFVRDSLGREIDFVVLRNRKPAFAVECKSGERGASKSLKYFKERTKIPELFQVHLGTKSFLQDGIAVLPFAEFCMNKGI